MESAESNRNLKKIIMDTHRMFLSKFTVPALFQLFNFTVATDLIYSRATHSMPEKSVQKDEDSLGSNKYTKILSPNLVN